MRRLAIVLVALVAAPTVHALVTPVDTNSLLLRFGGPQYPRVTHTVQYVGDFAIIGVDSPAGVGKRYPFPHEPVRLIENGASVLGETVTDADGRFAFTTAFPTIGPRQLHVESDRDWRSRTVTVSAADVPDPPIITLTAPGVPWDIVHIGWADGNDNGAPITYRSTQLYNGQGGYLRQLLFPFRDHIMGTGAWEVRSSVTNVMGTATSAARIEVPAPEPVDPFTLGEIVARICVDYDCYVADVSDGGTYTTKAAELLVGLQIDGLATRAGVPVAGDAIMVGGVLDSEGIPRSGVRTLTSSDGRFNETTYLRYLQTPPPGECRLVNTTVAAIYPGTSTEKRGAFTVCRL